MTHEEPNELERFTRWFVVPYNKLKEVPEGDGAFVALSMGFFLCERYYKAEVGLENEETSSKDDISRNKAAEDLGVHQKFFLHFWQVFRNGMLHQATPRTYSVDGIDYKWSIDANYDAIPAYFDKDGCRIICINPWKFTELMVQKILKKPDCLAKSIRYELGRIRPNEAAYPLTKVTPSQMYPS